MEMSILQQIKKKAGRLIETQLLKTGRVLDVRIWAASAMVEIDLHLPQLDMQQWNEVPAIKFRVADLNFRDYTPFGWDAETSTCSILVDVAHDGAGSLWAKQLQTGDCIHYLKVESTRQSPHPTDFVVGLGDASSLGHLLALRQLTMPDRRFEGAVVLDNTNTVQSLNTFFPPALHTLSSSEKLLHWLEQQGYCTAHTWFYLTGNQRMVVELRRLLKGLGHEHIRVKGFWS